MVKWWRGGSGLHLAVDPGRVPPMPAAHRFLIWDTEHTAWHGSAQRKWGGFIPGSKVSEHREIFQLSALEVHVSALADSNPSRVTLAAGRSFRTLVRPTLHPVLSSYIKDLTNVTQAELDSDGKPLEVALNQLHRLAMGKASSAKGHQYTNSECATPLLSWGNDWPHVIENYRLHQRAMPPHLAALGGPCSRDIRVVFEAAGLSLRGYHSGTIYSHPLVALEARGRAHVALWDCTSILMTMQLLIARHASAVSALHQLLTIIGAPQGRNHAYGRSRGRARRLTAEVHVPSPTEWLRAPSSIPHSVLSRGLLRGGSPMPFNRSAPLWRIVRRLRARQPLVVTAIGQSNTVGYAGCFGPGCVFTAPQRNPLGWGNDFMR